MSFSTFSYRSPKKFKAKNPPSGSTSSTIQHHNKEWNSYLTDDDKFRLSNNEVLKRKQQLISKHNILAVPPSAGAASVSTTFATSFSKKTKIKQSKTIKIPTSSQQHRAKHPDDHVSGEEHDALDLLTTSLDHDHNEFRSFAHHNYHSEDEDHNSEEGQQEEGSSDEEEQQDGDTWRTKSQGVHERKPLRSSNTSKRSPQIPPAPATSTAHKKNTSLKQQHQQSRQQLRQQQQQRQQRHQETQLAAPQQKDLKEIGVMIQSLHQELRYYEELSGRRSFLDVDELTSTIDFTSSDGSTISYTATMRYLVQLVCQTMSYLLKSEVELDKQRENFSLLSSKIDQLFAMQQQHSTQQPLSTKPFNPSPFPSAVTPLSSRDSEDLLRSERSDKTTNLYERHHTPSASAPSSAADSSSGSSIYATPYSDLSSSTTSTPYSPFPFSGSSLEHTPASFASASSANRKKGQVTFNLPSSSSPALAFSSPHAQQTQRPQSQQHPQQQQSDYSYASASASSLASPVIATAVPFRESKLGTSSTDWLFQTTRDMFSPASHSISASASCPSSQPSQPHSTTFPHQHQQQGQGQEQSFSLSGVSQMDPSSRFGSMNDTPPALHTHRDHSMGHYASTSFTSPAPSAAGGGGGGVTHAHAPPNRMTELQQQLAIMRHDVSGVKGYGITNKELPLSNSSPSATSVSTSVGSSYHSDPLRQWLKWTGNSHSSGNGGQHSNGNSFDGRHSVEEINQLSIPPPPPPPSASAMATFTRSQQGQRTQQQWQGRQGQGQQDLKAKAIHIPRAQIPPKDHQLSATEQQDEDEEDSDNDSEWERKRERDSEEEDDEEEMPLHLIYNPSLSAPSPSPALSQSQQQRQRQEKGQQRQGQRQQEEEELPSQHAISSSLLPTPERAPLHPHGSPSPLSPPSSTSFSSSVPLYPPSSAVAAVGSPFQRTYDARNGSYGR